MRYITDAMKMAVSSDEENALTGYVLGYLKRRGYKVVRLGALRKKGVEWVDSSRELAEWVAEGNSDEGILFCWTGTGASIAANKIPGIRAALCVDAEQAKGARRWNHANILVMGMMLTSPKRAKEILDAWFSTKWGKENFNLRNASKLNKLEKKYFR